MNLEARAADCFSATLVLKLNGRPVGKVERRWFSEDLDVDLIGQRHFQFRKVSWLGSDFELVDPARDEVVASCGRSGLLSSSWDLQLSAGAGQLVKADWLGWAYEVRQDDEVRARVDRLGWCERGWQVEADRGLTDADVLLVGLVFHTIQSRNDQSATHAAGS